MLYSGVQSRWRARLPDICIEGGVLETRGPCHQVSLHQRDQTTEEAE